MVARKPITPERETLFLRAYVASGGSFSAAVRAANPHLPQTTESGNVGGHQSWRDHLKRNLPFAERFAEARQEIADELISIAHERIKQGTAEPLMYRGRQGVDHEGKPAVRVKYSDTLLLAKLRALVADYSEHSHIHHHLHHGDRWQVSSTDLEALSPAEYEAFVGLLSKIHEHRTQQPAPVIEDQTDYVAVIEAEIEAEAAD